MTKEQITNFFKTKGAYACLIVVAIVVLVFIGWKYTGQRESLVGLQVKYPETLFVTFLDFNQQSVSGDSSILATFSQPVEPHELEHFWELTPKIPGRFDQGGSETEIRFVPEWQFESGINYTVTIKANLASKIGSKLQEDFTRVLALGFSADDFKILKNGQFSLLQSVQQSDLSALRTQVGTNVKDANLKIFKANKPENIISAITAFSAPVFGEEKPVVVTNLVDYSLVKSQEKVAHNAAVEIPAAVGVYLVQTLKGTEVYSQVWVTVNTFGVYFRQDDQKFIVAAQDLGSGNPVSGVELKTFTFDNESKVQKQAQKLTFSDIQEFPLVYPDKIDFAIARKGNEYAYIPVNLFGSLAEIGVFQNLATVWQGFLYTERPIYKPTDVIKFRGILRRDNDASYSLPPMGSKVQLSINGQTTDSSIRDREFTVNEHGVFSGEITLNGQLKPGQYYTNVSLVGVADSYISSSGAWFEVLEYKKPDFELTASTDKEEYVEGDTVTVMLKGSRFDGKAFGKQTVKYTVYALDYYETEKAVYSKSFQLNGWGGMCGGGFDPFNSYYGEVVGEAREVVLNASGDLALTFDTKKLTKNVSQQLTFVEEKQDGNGNAITGAKSVTVHNGEINIFLRSFKNVPKTNTPPTAVFSAETLTGDKLKNQSFDYTIEQVRYEYSQDGQSNLITKPVVSKKVQTNSEGIGEFTVEGLDKLEPGFDTVEVSVKRRDGRGNQIVASQSLYVYGGRYQYELPTVFTITSNQSNLVPGQNVVLKIVSPTNVKALVAFERGRVYDTQWVDVKAGEHSYEFPVKDVYMPTISPTFSAFYKNRYYSEGLTFNVPAMKKLVNVHVTTDKEEYKEGQVAKVTIKTTDQRGAPVSASLSLAVIDKAIFALRKGTELPLHSTFYYFRPRRTNNSSSMTGISFGEGAEQGGGGGDIGGIGAKDVDVLYWNPDLVTDATGEVTVFIPVTGNTIWKGVIYVASDSTDLGQTTFEFSAGP